ncbi:hypothetical protein T07_2327 [Trichinella nelsoni]|uniref:Uncharacterized protein n=1 Tax=Trichinella nelsoni TaxID=6336 RepID=A0A0V0SN90_9BILA|nr:hypothetical protein T07_2327 [Trichinella nelsoni]
MMLNMLVEQGRRRPLYSCGFILFLRDKYEPFHVELFDFYCMQTDDPGKEEKEMTRPSGEKANAPLT